MTHAVPHVFFLDLWLGVDCSCCFDATHSHLHAVRGRLPSYFHFRGWLVLSTMMVQVVCYGIFWEIPSGNVPVFSAIWFDNGYMFASAHEVLSDKGVDMPVVMLDSLVQSSWPGCGCACRCATTGTWSDSAECRAGAAVAVHRRSMASLRAADGPACSDYHIETPQLQSVRWSKPLLCRSCHARCRATGAHGSDTAENCGGAAGAATSRLWTSL